MSLLKKYEQLETKAINKLHKLIDKKGVESKFSNTPCLPLTNPSNQYTFGNGNYSLEITKEYIIDQNGYQYNIIHSIGLYNLLEIVDYY